MPPAAGDASPPGPPDRQGAGAAYGFEFLLCKNCKTGVIIYKPVGSIRDIRHRVLPGRDPTAKPLAVGDILCATAPCYRCLIENQAALRTRSGGRKAARPACLQNGRLPRGIIYRFICSIGDTCHRVLPGRDPTAKPLAVGDILCATAPCYRCLIENQAALRTRSGGRKAARPACLQNGRLPPVNRFRRPGLFRSLPSDIAIRNKQCPNRADRFTAHH